MQSITNSIIIGNVSNRAELHMPVLYVTMFAVRTSGLRYGGRWRDTSGLVGIGRASDLDEADTLAENQCENMVDSFEHEDGYHGQRRYQLECLKIASTRC
jgi:hypothetical protein